MVGTVMGTTLALCGAVAGWCVMVLVSRRRLALLRVHCDDTEAENTRWRQAHGGRVREPADGQAPPHERDREPAAGGVRARLLVPDDLLVEPGGAAFPETAAVRTPAAGPRESSPAGRPTRANGPQDGRPAKLPQRRRPPTMAPTAPPPHPRPEPKTAEKPGPEQRFDAFHGGRPESADGANRDADQNGTSAVTHDRTHDGERGAAS